MRQRHATTPRFGHLPRLLAAAVFALALAGCNPEEYVVATIAPTQGNSAKGEVRFYKEEGGVRVVAKLEGLTQGAHGFHLHEKGDCSAPDAMSAGGHYNPAGAPHGAPDADGAHRHAGDLGNVEAGVDGKATVNRVDPLLVYENLAGLAVLVHANPDDLASQPAGNAGPRVGCGVIQARP
ncbi:MAG TPA: superoxide dismutase family protein [Acidobacteriota bacterium]|nr:superoxide dismutase family protein [Acidobacteriota bacterium]